MISTLLTSKTISFKSASSALCNANLIPFFNNNDGDRIFWVNTVSPLQTIGDIKNFVKIGQELNWKSGVSINSKLCIGDNSQIGLGSAVTKSVPKNISVFGNPARPLPTMRKF